MFDALIDRENAQVARAAQTPVIERLMKAAEDARRLVTVEPYLHDEIGARKMDELIRMVGIDLKRFTGEV